jgi:hypothetical protein
LSWQWTFAGLDGGCCCTITRLCTAQSVSTNSWLSTAYLFSIRLCTPDLVPAGFFLFPCIINGARFADVAAIQECARAVLWSIHKRPLLTVSRSFMNVANSVLWRMAIILKANKVKLFVASVLIVFW